MTLLQLLKWFCLVRWPSLRARELPDGGDLSIGCVPVPPETENFEPLIDQADREMYRRKRALAS